jgi:di- and tripeptidase
LLILANYYVWQKYSTVQYGKYQDTRSFGQKYHCVNRWKAHEGRVLASAVTNYNGQQLYITGANDNSVSIWNVTSCHSGTYGTPELHENQLIKSLQEFVSFKTISSRPDHAEDCRRGATFLRTLFKKHGARTEMLNTDSHYNPIVYAKFKGNSTTSDKRKKILFYGHCKY